MITVKEVGIETILKVHPNIIEFDDPSAEASFFLNRYQKEKHLVVAAFLEEQPIGYLIAYEKEDSFYCWLGGVDSRYRRQGAMTEMMNYVSMYAKKEGYKNLTVKTRNDKRNMLHYLVKNEWYFTKIKEQENILNNEIYLEKGLNSNDKMRYEKKRKKVEI